MVYPYFVHSRSLRDVWTVHASSWLFLAWSMPSPDLEFGRRGNALSVAARIDGASRFCFYFRACEPNSGRSRYRVQVRRPMILKWAWLAGCWRVR